MQITEMTVLQKQSDNSYKALKAQVLASTPYDVTGGDPLTKITVITGWQYDATNHLFQIKTRDVYVLKPGDESAWTTPTGGVLDQGVIP